MPAGDIDRFMEAIMAQESGGRSQVANKRTGAHGLFQIMPGNWSPWAREAGLGANAPKTPENQRKVARFKMQQYYRDYGSWDLVAAAWFGGPGAASKLKRGDKSVLGRSDGNMTIGQYIEKMNRGMGTGGSRAAGLDRSIGAQGPTTHEQHLDPPDIEDPEEMWRTILTSLADQAAGGKRQPLDELAMDDGGMMQPLEAGGGFDQSIGLVNEATTRWGPDAPEPIPDAEDPLLPQPGAQETNRRIPGLPELGNVVPGRGGVPKGLKENAARGAAAARALGFSGTIGGLGKRANKSDHPDGNAIDLMTMDDLKQGQLFADFFVKNAQSLGVKYVIFNRTIWSANSGWKPKRMADRGSPTANHVDHPHISFY